MNGKALTALTIAGFDPSSGAGVTADLAVFAAHGVFGTSAITALTVQSTMGVRRVEPVDGQLLEETLACLADDLPPAGVKIGMLGGAAQVRAAGRFLRGLPGPVKVVLDPVVQSSSGAELLRAEGREVLLAEVLQRVDVLTPNVGELELLTGVRCVEEAGIREACGWLAARFPRMSVVATGGHRAQPDDLVLHEGRFEVLRGAWIRTSATHGTGCAFSSAMLCRMLHGDDVPLAAAAAKAYVAEAMRRALPRGLGLGRGKGPMHLLWPFDPA